MDMTIEVVQLSEADRTNLEALVPNVEIYHSTGVVGGDPVWIIAISSLATAVATASGGLAKLLHEWQKSGIQRRVQIKEGKNSRQLDFRGLSAKEIDELLTTESKLSNEHSKD
jgi:hypothetical protein